MVPKIHRRHITSPGIASLHVSILLSVLHIQYNSQAHRAQRGLLALLSEAIMSLAIVGVHGQSTPHLLRKDVALAPRCGTEG